MDLQQLLAQRQEINEKINLLLKDKYNKFGMSEEVHNENPYRYCIN
jgi:hypothetical protein